MKKLSFAFILFILGAALLAGCASPNASPTSVPPAAPAAASTAAPTLQPGDSERTVSVDGLQRTYLLHIPPNLAAGKPVPLVFVFHGLEESGALIRQSSGMNEISDSGGFIVAYPEGTGPSSVLSWNAGGCCGYAQENKVDEAAFVRQILVDVGTLASIDTRRVYASGFSNGALLSYRLACEMSDTFAAVAPVAGVLLSSPCQPTHPVAVIAFHGLNDTSVPYAGGGTIPGSGMPFPAVEESIAAWVQLDGCTNSPKVEQTGLLTHTTYAACLQGTAVELYTVKGLGHVWPIKYIVPASQIIWDFFAAHPRP